MTGRPQHHPLFLDLAGRDVLVAGGGPVAQRRTEALLAAAARVTVVAPQMTEGLLDLEGAGRIRWKRREFARADVDGMWLVHACTGGSSTDDAVIAAAEESRVWSVRASNADRSPAWSAATAATVDGIQFAVSAGRDPRRAQALRDAISTRAAEGTLPVRRIRPAPGTVFLVGGGPGDPDLMTVRARKLLSLADVVVTDRLAPGAALDGLADDVEVVDVGKSPGHHTMTQHEINEVLVDRAQAGKVVVRLKGGDPFLLGRGGEEAQHCLAAGVAVEIVPGVTSALSVPAAAGIPVTHRGAADSVLILSAHNGAGEVVRRAACTPTDTTLVLLMGVRHLGESARALIDAGRPADLPAAVVSNGWTPEQQTVVGTLADIAGRCAEASVASPAVMIIGEVAALHDRLGELARISVDAGHGGTQ